MLSESEKGEISVSEIGKDDYTLLALNEIYGTESIAKGYLVSCRILRFTSYPRLAASRVVPFVAWNNRVWNVTWTTISTKM